MYAAIDLLADKLDRLLMKHKEQIVDHHRGESLARTGNSPDPLLRHADATAPLRTVRFWPVNIGRRAAGGAAA